MNAVDMSQFIAAKSDQLNADDLMDAPKTITITKVTAAPDAAEQPVSIHYEGGEGRPWKPCKTMRRILVGVWGKDASKYVGRSLTLYRDPTVAFGGLQVGGIRISHMSDITEDKTVALLVTRGRKAPFKIKPLAITRPAGGSTDDAAAKWANGYIAKLDTFADLKAVEDFEAQKAVKLEELQSARPDLHAQVVSALQARKAALSFAPDPDEPADTPGDQPPAVNDRTLATELGLDDHPGQAKAGEIIAEIEACISTLDVTALVNRHQADIEAMPPELGASIEIAADKRRKAIEAEREKEPVK
jgi:hypothetical protein